VIINQGPAPSGSLFILALIPEDSNLHVYCFEKLGSPEEDEVTGHLLVLAAMKCVRNFGRETWIERTSLDSLQGGLIS